MAISFDLFQSSLKLTKTTSLVNTNNLLGINDTGIEFTCIENSWGPNEVGNLGDSLVSDVVIITIVWSNCDLFVVCYSNNW